MSRSTYRPAEDKLPARVSGEWAREKLGALAGYFEIVNRAMVQRRTFQRVCYVDLMAGGGKCVLKRSFVEFDGSPLLALAAVPPFSSLVLVEEEPELFAALTQRTVAHADRTTLIGGDANDPDVIQAIRSAVPTGALSIAFIDNLGLDVTFETISRLTFGRRMDLVITFQVSDIRRNVEHALRLPWRGVAWDLFFGTSTWRQAVEHFEARTTAAPTLGEALADFYSERLATIGYQFRTQLPQPMRNSRNASLYRVMLFSKNALAVRLFDASSRSVRDRDLFD